MADSKRGRNTLRKMAAGALCLQMGLCMPFTAAYAEEAPAVVAEDGRVTVSAGPETAEAAPAEGTIVVPGGAEAAPAANTEEPKVPAPVTQEGRYEADENLLLPGFSYTPNTSHEVDGRQGVAFADGSYYVSGSTTISCYDGDWNLIASAENPFEGLPEGTNHIGDIDVYNGSVYAGVEYFADGAADKAVIAVYDAKTLILTDTYAVDPASGQTEVSGIAVDPDNQTIWLTSWDESESGSSLYRYDLETGDYLGKVLLQPAPEYIQGIAYYDGWLYLTADDGVADEGSLRGSSEVVAERIRQALDANGFNTTPIMAYSVKYASGFYGPFREAADSAPAFGDRRAYQMDVHNRREAIKKALQDIEQGADIVMVKPAMSFLDLVREVHDAVDVPVAAYSVSGEYAMVKAAAERGWIDEERIVGEMATSAFRAGAHIYLTYYAELVAKLIDEGVIG